MEIWKGRLADNEYHGGKHPDEADFVVKINNLILKKYFFFEICLSY